MTTIFPNNMINKSVEIKGWTLSVFGLGFYIPMMKSAKAVTRVTLTPRVLKFGRKTKLYANEWLKWE